MKKTLLTLASLFCFTGLIYADICADVQQSYQDRMLALKRDTDAALSQTTDPMEISAIRASYDIQLQQLTMEMNNALASAGCVTTPPPPPQDPPTDPQDPPTDPQNPPTDPNDPPTDPGAPPSDSCRDQLKIYADQLKGLGLPRHEFVSRLKAHAREIGCNFGSWQRCEHGNSGHHDCQPKPSTCQKPKPSREDCHRHGRNKDDDRGRRKDKKCDR